MLAVTPAEIAEREYIDFIDTEAGLRRVTNYYGGDPRDDRENHPSAFMVAYQPEPGKDIRPHFHRIAQFHILVSGDGYFGEFHAPTFTFHYADPLTPYGPIRSADDTDPIDFLTLRPVARPGVFWMARSAHELDGPGGRNIVTPVPDVALPTTGVEVVDLIEPHDDGLAGYVVRLSPGAQHPVTVPSHSAGQYQLVTKGSLAMPAGNLPVGSLMFAKAGEENLLKAGDQGCEILVTRYPAKMEP